MRSIVEAPAGGCPDEILEYTPGVHPVTCDDCDGTGYVEAAGTAWYSDRLEQFYPCLVSSYVPCSRCSGSGEILDYEVPTWN